MAGRGGGAGNDRGAAEGRSRWIHAFIDVIAINRLNACGYNPLSRFQTMVSCKI